MKQITYSIARRILIIGLLAGTFALLGWGALIAAAKPDQIKQQADPFSPNPVIPSNPAGQPASIVHPPVEQAGLLGVDQSLTSLGLADESSAGSAALPASFSLSSTPLLTTPTSSFPPAWVADLLRADHPRAVDVDIVKLVTTPQSPASTALASVFLNQVITYTIIMTNRSNANLTNVVIVDTLPKDTLADVGCVGGNCGIISETKEVDNFGTITTIFIPRIVTGSLGTLAPNESKQLVLTGTVTCQPEGTVFTNRAVVSYVQNGAGASGQSNQAETIVRVLPGSSGGFNTSSRPTWCSEEPGGVYDLDWGDFDNDGDLDLALASTLGTIVYRTGGGQLTRFWANDRFTFAARWADVNNDNRLELLTLSRNGTDFSNFSGFVYRQSGNEFIEHSNFANGLDGLLRMAPADYDRDNQFEVVVLSYQDSCGLFFFENNGAGVFTPDPNNSDCLANTSARSLAWGDYDNDGDPDLAVGKTGNQVFLNNGSGLFTTTNAVTIDPGAGTMFDLVWGDYDRDGFLDLAAAFGTSSFRIYRRNPAAEFDPPIIKSATSANLGIDWADFNSDGRLELAVADAQSQIFRFRNNDFEPFITLPRLVDAFDQEIWRVRGADYDRDGDLDLTIGNRDGQSALFTTFTPLLSRTLTIIKPSPLLGAAPAGSVAWGDADNDGLLDLLLGAGPPPQVGAIGSKLYFNDTGTFSIDNLVSFGNFGPHSVAFADFDGDRDLDFGLGAATGNQVYQNNLGTFDLFWEAPDVQPTTSIAWADYDNDDDLDLAVGNNGGFNQVYRFEPGSPPFTLAWATKAPQNTRSLAWGDFDGDRDPDLAVGNDGQPSQLYRNDRVAFTLVWTSIVTANTHSVAWADFDGDGDLDLALGNKGQPNVIYPNLTQQNPAQPALGLTPIWTAPNTRNTTSLAWGDWDSDDDLDLAAGNEGQPDQVYANLSRPGSPQLLLTWTSTESYDTTGLAWGDQDGDGDLDLAISQDGDGQNGVYENHAVTPSHLTSLFTRTMLLPNNPAYLAIERPGQTAAAYFFSSAEILSGELVPTVTIRYQLFDPDGTRQDAGSNAFGDKILHTIFQYSLDGGGTWQTASPRPGAPGPVTRTTRLGQPATFLWDAQGDQAISDNARFRITIIPQASVGLTQHAPASAISPPFRVRGLTCTWPRDPVITVSTSDGQPPQPGQPVNFMGSVAAGSGPLTFDWNFGDSSPVEQGQLIQHIFPSNNTYSVVLTVTGIPCPVTEPASVTLLVPVGTGIPNIYLPLLLKGSSGSPATPTSIPSGPALQLALTAGSPAQVTGLTGQSRLEAGLVHLSWSPNPAAGAVLGYRIYRAAVGALIFHQLAEVPAGATTYTDAAGACGQMYLVTAYNAAGESLPSTTSYFSRPCQ